MYLGPPNAPTAVSAVSLYSSATVSWTVPSNNGGVAISHYTVTESVGHTTVRVTGSDVTSVLFTPLTKGTSPTFTVVATNFYGVGDISAASSPPEYIMGERWR